MTKYKGALTGIILLIVIWEFAAALSGIPKWLLPAPSDIAVSLVKDLGLILLHSGYTLTAAVAGLLFAVAAGVLLALAMDYWPSLESALYPLLVVSQAVPVITLAPLIIMWLGYGLIPKVAVAGLICFFPLTVSVVGGMQASDRDMADLLKVMGASRWQVLRLARLPAALPYFFSGLKISATYSVMGAIIGEWLGSAMGLGVILNRFSHSYQTPRAFAVVIIIVVMSLALFFLAELIARLVMPWNYRNRPY
ncbi:MAG: ABC transporter permease [Bacillota bacterium]